ncbi:MAG: DUF2339 domain-containing protein [Bacteroidota bacterium]
MNGEHNQLNEIQSRLDILTRKSESLQQEVRSLKQELDSLQIGRKDNEEIVTAIPDPVPVVFRTDPIEKRAKLPFNEPTPAQPNFQFKKRESFIQGNLEKFIGENLINKIGIAILIIGVGIGARFAIDHQWISPWMRIILGYFMGGGLMGVSIYLFKKYQNFSSVLLGGSMAIFYFITFAAYSFYSLIPLPVTFGLMLLFTIFTVAAAIRYDRQVIAHIGMVGAYAVPFLLSDGSGNVKFLFSYMVIINCGILVIAFRKSWKYLYYAAFLLTWIIFISWFSFKYDKTLHFATASLFIIATYLTFYTIFLSYKLFKKEKFVTDDILFMLLNSFLFYGFGYGILGIEFQGKFLGIYTAANALINLAVLWIISRFKDSDKGLYYFTLALVITFLTIAIPVQWDGNWVTLLWTVESAFLFWIGRTKGIKTYELLSYALIFLSFFSLVGDWQHSYDSIKYPDTVRIIPLFNINLISSVMFILSLGYINFLHFRKEFISPLQGNYLFKVMNILIPAFLILALYFSFFVEIVNIWNQVYQDTLVNSNFDKELISQIMRGKYIDYYKATSIFFYTLLFVSALIHVNDRKFRSKILGVVNLGLGTLTTLLFLTGGLMTLMAIRGHYLYPSSHESHIFPGVTDLVVRYPVILAQLLLLYLIFRSQRLNYMEFNRIKPMDIFLHFTLLVILSFELQNLMQIAGIYNSDKLGLSILFGSYSLFLIILGIWKKKHHLRIAAIGLFAATLIKFFVYDLDSMDTISKTIVFVVLGILLLIISFLYNRFKGLIFEDSVKEEEEEN